MVAISDSVVANKKLKEQSLHSTYSVVARHTAVAM